MLGQSSVGRRVFDLLRIMQLLRTEAAMPGGAKDPAGFRLRLVGRGQGAIIAALAALLDEGGPAVAVDLVHPPLSCAAWTEVALCTWPVSSFVRGLLAHCDLLYNVYSFYCATGTAFDNYMMGQIEYTLFLNDCDIADPESAGCKMKDLDTVNLLMMYIDLYDI